MNNDSAQFPRIHVQLDAACAGKVRRVDLRKAVRAAFESAGKECSAELTVFITDDAQIQELNRVYRGVDAPTDVLAFGGVNEAGAFVSSPEASAYLGDIIVSYPRAVEQAAAYEHAIQEELLILVVHGVLHLLDYDHERVEDKEEMWGAQSAALARLGIHWQP